MENARIFSQVMPWVVAALVLMEALIVFLRGQESNIRERLKETSANFAVYLGNQFLRQLVWRFWALGLLTAAYQVRLFEIQQSPLSFAVLFVAVDFLFYWEHRWFHEIRLLWAIHSVHHSSDRFNLSTAIRLSWLGGLWGPVCFVPLALVGFDPILILLSLQLNLLYQLWVHTEKVGKLGWFDSVFNSPSNHRVHHGSNPQYLDKNHAGILMLWDRLFGTYEEEREEVVYGLVKPIESRNPFVINFKEFFNIARDVRNSKSLRGAWLHTFGRPGWSPLAGESAESGLVRHT